MAEGQGTKRGWEGGGDLDPNDHIGDLVLVGGPGVELHEGAPHKRAVQHEIQHGEKDHEAGDAQLLVADPARQVHHATLSDQAALSSHIRCKPYAWYSSVVRDAGTTVMGRHAKSVHSATMTS